MDRCYHCKKPTPQNELVPYNGRCEDCWVDATVGSGYGGSGGSWLNRFYTPGGGATHKEDGVRVPCGGVFRRPSS